eukprot:gene10961-3669_t
MSCEYEKLREKNIERNNAMLKFLGLKKSPKKKTSLKKNSVYRKSVRLTQKEEDKKEKRNPKLKEFYGRKKKKRKLCYEDEEEDVWTHGTNDDENDDLDGFICDEISFISEEEEEEEEIFVEQAFQKKKDFSFIDEEDEDEISCIQTPKYYNKEHDKDFQIQTPEHHEYIGDPTIDLTNTEKTIIEETYIEDSDLDDEKSQFSKPIIMFTGISNPEKYEKPIRKLGGRIEHENISKVTHIISSNIKRTTKFLCAISNGCKYFLTIDWLENSIKKNYFVQESSYFIDDIETESKYDFNLKESILNSSKKKVFEGMKFFLTPNSFPDIFELKKIIKYGRGIVILDKEKVTNEMIHLQIISCEQDKDFY